jgi:3-hydroxyisobutyrate dehydrogenase-like beta-hydroxyacid dehydrogenase
MPCILRRKAEDQIMKIGLVGLGRMGAAIAQRLRQNGFDVLAWDRRAEANQAMSSDGLPIAENPRAVAGASDVVISIITEDHGVREIFAGPRGFLTAAVSGKLFIEMSTLQPMTARELAPQVEAKGGRLIDSPVLGTIPQVRDGKLFALIGGRAEDLERARPVLEKLTRRIAHMGPNGNGYAMKLAVNLGLGAYIQALAESLALGSKYNLTIEQMLDVLQEAPYASNWLRSKIDVLKGGTAEKTLDIQTLRKDIMSAVATGALSGIPMPLSAGVLASLSAATANGYGGGDLAELPHFLRTAMLQNLS